MKQSKDHWGSQDLREQIQKEEKLIKVSLTFGILFSPQVLFGIGHKTSQQISFRLPHGAQKHKTVKSRVVKVANSWRTKILERNGGHKIEHNTWNQFSSRGIYGLSCTENKGRKHQQSRAGLWQAYSAERAKEVIKCYVEALSNNPDFYLELLEDYTLEMGVNQRQTWTFKDCKLP